MVTIKVVVEAAGKVKVPVPVGEVGAVKVPVSVVFEVGFDHKLVGEVTISIKVPVLFAVTVREVLVSIRIDGF